jgi:hypothetical protein
MKGDNRLPGRCKVTGKIRFATEEDARVAAKRIRKKFGSKLHQYQCQYCGTFHNGHNRPTHKRRAQPWDKKPKSDP